MNELLKNNLLDYFSQSEAEIFIDNFTKPQRFNDIKFLGLDAVAKTMYFAKVSNFVFGIIATPKQNNSFQAYFPALTPVSTEDVGIDDVQENDSQNSHNHVSIKHAVLADAIWLYLYYSNDNEERMKSLTEELLKDSSSSLSTLFPEHDGIGIIKQLKEISLGEGTFFASHSVWNGGLFYFADFSVWPLEAMKSDAGFFGESDFFDSLGKIKINGCVYYPGFFPYLKLNIPLGHISFGSESLNKGYLSFEVNSPAFHLSQDVTLALIGKLTFGSALELDVKGKWDFYQSNFELKAVCKIRQIPFLDHTSIPGLENYDPELDIGIDILISKSKKKVTIISLALEVDNWDIITDVLSLAKLQFSVDIYDPGDFNLTIATVDAQAQLGKNKVLLNVGGSYPTGDLYFQLDPSTTIHLHEIIAAFFGNHGGLPDHLEITELNGQFNYTTKEMRFSMAIDETVPWKIANGFELKNMRLAVGGQGSYSGNIFGSFAIGVLDFEVTANIGDGWSFEANCDASGLSLAQLFKKLKYTKTPKLPDYLANITIEEVELSFNSPSPDADGNGTNSRVEKHFKITGSDNTKVAIKFELKLDITYPDGINQDFAFSGHLTLNDQYVFDIIQQKDGKDKTFLAAYHQEADAETKIDIADLLDTLGVSGAPSLKISLQDAFFANDKKGTKEFKLLVADVGAGMNLSNLPLVGKVLPADATVALALRILYVSDTYGFGVDKLNAALPDGISKISKPEGAKDKKGFDLIAEINIGEHKFYLELPVEIKDDHNKNRPITKKPNTPSNQPTTAAGSPNSPSAVPVNDGITWFKIGKKFGPVIFNRIGLTYSGGKLTVYPDAALSMGGLSFTLNGLSVSSPISPFKPTFALKGLGLDFEKGPIEIGASFLRRPLLINAKPVLDKSGNPVYEYDGTAIIKTDPFSISALGSYAYYQGHPSLFIYVYLNRALGGPAFFFVEGLAAAFGYNRALIMPTIDQVSNFPLVRQVMAGEDPAKGAADHAALLSEQLDAIAKYVPPTIGQMFLAVGVKFNSFKLIDSFAMIAVSFGNHSEIDVLGQSNIIVPSEMPTGVPPLAEIKIQLMAKFLPDEGFLGVQAQLTSDSYIFEKNCHLTGGAAFYSWFKGEHGGDFVVTMGGYHPQFQVPSHYPKVPRLGLNWQVSDTFSIKGDMYFALCSHAFMAGGHLEALYHDGPLRAWFKAGADFLISWQPYHYDAHIYLDIGASYTYHLFGTHHITLDLSADVHVWGPEFAGEASLHIWIFNVSVAFGPQGKQSPIPISWKEFQDKCLPGSDKILSAVVTQGQHKEDSKNGKKMAVVNPKELRIDLNSAVPITAFSTPSRSQLKGSPSFGVAPMDFTKSITSTLSITINQDGAPLPDGERENFVFSTQTKKVPSAVWGRKFSPALNEKEKTIELVTGLSIATKEPVEFPNKSIPGGTSGTDYDIEFEVELDTSHFIELQTTKLSEPVATTNFQHDKDSNALLAELNLSDINVLSLT